MSKRIWGGPDGVIDTRSHFLMSRVSGIAGLTVPGPQTWVDYSVIYMSANQAISSVDVGEHIEFDSEYHRGLMSASDVTVSTGVGQANGVITLSGARRYLMFLTGYTTTNEGYFRGDWKTPAGAQILDESGLSLTFKFSYRDSGSANDNNIATLHRGIVDATAADIDMEMRFDVIASSIHYARLQAAFHPLDALV